MSNAQREGLAACVAAIFLGVGIGTASMCWPDGLSGERNFGLTMAIICGIGGMSVMIAIVIYHFTDPKQ